MLERTRITQAHITRWSKSEPPPKNVFYLDETPGFAVKHAPSGKLTYVVRAKSPGERRQQVIKIANVDQVRPLDARNKALTVLHEIRSGRYVAHDRRSRQKAARINSVTLQQAFEEKLRETVLDQRTKQLVPALKKSTVESYWKCFQYVPSALRSKPVTQITAEEVATLLRQLERERLLAAAPIKLKRMLSSVLSYAIAQHHLNCANPTKDLKGVVSTPSPKTGRIPHDEIGTWLTKVMKMGRWNPIHRDLVLFQLLHGMRPGEAARLRWSMVDFQNKTWTVDTAKDGGDHTLPFTSESERLLKRRFQKRSPDDVYVFPSFPRGRRATEKTDGKPRGHVTNMRTTIWKAFGGTFREGKPVGRSTEEVGFELHDIRRSVRTFLGDHIRVPTQRIEVIQDWASTENESQGMQRRYYGAELSTVQLDLQRYHDWLGKKLQEANTSDCQPAHNSFEAIANRQISGWT